MSEVVEFVQFMNFLRGPDFELPENAPYWMIYAEVLKGVSRYKYPDKDMSNAEVFLSYAKDVSDYLLENIYNISKSGFYDRDTKVVIVELVGALDFFTDCIQNVIMKLPCLENDREYLQLNFAGNDWKNLAIECYTLYYFIGDFINTQESSGISPITPVWNPLYDLPDDGSDDDELIGATAEEGEDEFIDAIEDEFTSPPLGKDRAKALEDNLTFEAYKFNLVLVSLALITLSLIAFCTSNVWFAPSTEPSQAPLRPFLPTCWIDEDFIAIIKNGVIQPPPPPSPVLPTCWINEDFIEIINNVVVQSPPASTGRDLHHITMMACLFVCFVVTGFPSSRLPL